VARNLDAAGDEATSPPAPATSTFAALAVPAFRRLWLAGLVVFLSVTGQAIARGWLARDLTGTNAGLGGVLLAFGVAMLVSTPFGGVAADRFPKRAVLVVSLIMLSASSLWIGAALLLGVVEYWMLLGASAVQAMAFALFGPARMSYITDIVGPDRLSNAIVLSQMGAESMRVIGPTIAGVAIASSASGLDIVFMASGVLTLASAVLTSLLPAGRPVSSGPTRSPLSEIRDAARYVRRRADLTALVGCSLSVVMIGYPFMAFLPSIADGVFDRGSTGYGVLSAVSAAGAVVTGLVVSRWGERYDPWVQATASGFAFGVGLVALGAAPSFVVAAVVLACTGGMSLLFQTTTNSLLLNLSAFEYHGRIQSIVMLGFSGFGIAALPLGALADLISLRATLALMGGGVLASMTVFVLNRRSYRERELARALG
jgi:MFS family permease